MKRSEFMTACKDAVDYVRSKLRLGAANKLLRWPPNVLQANIGVNVFRSHLGIQFYHRPIDEAWLRAIAIGAETAEAGNCGEQSAVAMVYLLNRGIRPIDYMRCTNRDHAFVLVARSANVIATKPETWGGAAVVCDPWYGTVFAGTTPEINRRRWQVQSIYRKD